MGATFAYFSVTGGDTNTTATVTGSTPEVGTVTFAKSVQQMHLEVDAAQMDKSNAPKTYYAVEGTSGLAKDSSVEHTLLTASVANSGTDVEYNCTGNVAVNLDGEMISEAKTGDMFIKFGGTLLNADTYKFSGLTTDAVDISDETTFGNLSSADISFTIKGNTQSPLTLTAQLYLVNKDDSEPGNGNQQHLINKELSGSINITGLDCHAKTAAGE